MLIGENKLKMLKKALVLFFAFLFSIESLAAVVSDNDGAAFVTKAEFEALKDNFAEQINNYNTSIDSKIDGAIASYLKGIKTEIKSVVSTGFDLVGKSDKKVNFLGSTGSGWNLTNEIYAQDKLYGFANGGYGTGPDFWEQDGYDNWVWDGTFTRGNTSNTLFLIDANRCVKNVYWGLSLYISRIHAFYSTTNGRDGITWQDITTVLDLPTALSSTTSAGINSSSSAFGYGHSRGDLTSVYTTTINSRLFWANGMTNPYNPGIQCIRTPLERKTKIQLKNQYSVLMNKSESNYGIHFSYMPTQKVRTSDKTWGDISMITRAATTLQNYTVVNRVRYESGYWAAWAGTLTKTNKVQGYGVRINELLDASGNPKWTLNDIYYKELYDQWGNAEKLKYTGGFPVYRAEEEGTLEFRIKLNTAKSVKLAKNQKTSMPSSTDTDLFNFDYKLASSDTYTKNVNTLDAQANAEYDIKVELEKDDFLYLNIDVPSGVVIVNQTADAIWTS